MSISELVSRINDAKSRLAAAQTMITDVHTSFGIHLQESLRNFIRIGTVIVQEVVPALVTNWAENTGDPLAWGVDDWIASQGDPEYLRNYKNEWVRTHAENIQEAAERYGIPPYVLAGVAWTEAGGQPDSLDVFVYSQRDMYPWFDSLDELTLPGPLDRLPGSPEETSFGTIQMQIRVAAQELGYPDPDNLSKEQELEIAAKLLVPETNIDIVARHLDSLRDHDGFPKDPNQLTDEQIAVIATRYNRGTDPSLEDIQANPDYGNSLIRLRNEGLFEDLLN
jgi:hypothetical protein